MKEFKTDKTLIRQWGLGKQIDEVVDHQRHVKAFIYWNKEDTLFGSALQDMYFRDKDVALVKKWVKERLEALTTVEWRPVIIVMDMDARNHSLSYNNKHIQPSVVSFHFDRLWVAILPDGEARTCEWNTPEENRLDRYRYAYRWPNNVTPDMLPHKENSDAWFFTYSDELWAGLQAIAQGIDALRSRLTALLASPEGSRVLSDAGARAMKLLSAPEKENE